MRDPARKLVRHGSGVDDDRRSLAGRLERVDVLQRLDPDDPVELQRAGERDAPGSG